MRALLFALSLITTLKICYIRTENVQQQAHNDDVQENILSGNNTKLNELAPQHNNELVAYNQLLPYLYSKLPIPVSLIHQLRKYNINKNMLNKIHNYNKLRRELHLKLIENEVNGYKYNDILSKKLQSIFKNVNQEEKKNFMNLVNYMKMFNFENDKLYNTLHNGNDFLKLINDNKMKYLPFINTDKTLPDIFNNNKVNKEIRRILLQYKISSKDLYDKLVKKMNPYLLEDFKKYDVALETENKNRDELDELKPNNPYELLKERIEDLTSFRKKPKILPLNERIMTKKLADKNSNKKENSVDKKVIDSSLDKYIREMALLNQIEKERKDLVSSKINSLTNNQKRVAVKLSPFAQLIALYTVLSIPGLLSALPSKHLRLPHIKRTKEDRLHHSHIEAGGLYNKLMNKNVRESLNKVNDMIKGDKYNKLGKFKIENFDKVVVNKKHEGPVDKVQLPFGNEPRTNFINENDNYLAPKLADDFDSINKINGHNLYSLLQNKQPSRQFSVKGNVEVNGNNVFNVLSDGISKKIHENEVDHKVNGNLLFDQLSNSKTNINKIIEEDSKISEHALFDKLMLQDKDNGWKEDTVYSLKGQPEKVNADNVIHGNNLFNLLSHQTDLGSNKKTRGTDGKNVEYKIAGQHLFDLLSADDPKHPEDLVNKASKINMDKFYEKIYKKFMKDNKGTLNKVEAEIKKNKVLWHDQNVEIPNISDMTENKKQQNNDIKAQIAQNDDGQDNSKGAPKG